MYQKFATNQS